MYLPTMEKELSDIQNIQSEYDDREVPILLLLHLTYTYSIYLPSN